MFETAFIHTVGVEGKYSDHPSDPGGRTMYGITERVARAHGYMGDMRNLPLSKAKEIYKTAYWDAIQLDKVCVIAEDLAHEMFDTGVNMGAAKAVEFLQIALNSFNRQGKDYPDLKEDGQIGPATLKALSEFARVRANYDGLSVLLKAMNHLQGARYIELGRNRASNEDFTFGWVRART